MAHADNRRLIRTGTTGTILACVLLAACGTPDTFGAGDDEPVSSPVPSAEDRDASGASFSRGLATTTISSLIDCGKGSRVSAVGKIPAEDGSEWTLPADTSFTEGPKAGDLYNDCGGEIRGGVDNFNVSEIALQDAGSDEEFVAYMFADNYFELYVNGSLIAVDPVPFTPLQFQRCPVYGKSPADCGVQTGLLGRKPWPWF